MGEGIKVGGYNPIIIDDVEFKDTLKLSTKYQWVDDGDVLDLYNGTNQSLFPVFVEYKGETHAFLKNSVEHKKLVDGNWVSSVEQPNDYKFQSSAYYADDDYIYSLRVRDLYKFDGTNWTLVYTIPTKSTYDERIYPETADGNKNNGAGNLTFTVNNGKAYCSIKTSVYVGGYENFYYFGYIDLANLTWVDLPSAPSNDYIGYSKFGFIGSTIYMFCAKLSSPTDYVYVLDEAETAWTQIVSLPVSVHWLALGTLSISDGIYVVDGVELLYFDGSTFEAISDTDQVEIPNLIIHNNEFHLFYIRDIPYNTPSENTITYRRIAGVHKVLKKALYLEV